MEEYVLFKEIWGLAGTGAELMNRSQAVGLYLTNDHCGWHWVFTTMVMSTGFAVRWTGAQILILAP